jgi:hypothetical protein
MGFGQVFDEPSLYNSQNELPLLSSTRLFLSVNRYFDIIYSTFVMGFALVDLCS